MNRLKDIAQGLLDAAAAENWADDALWVGVVTTTILGYLPQVAAGFACVHYAVQIWRNWPKR